MPPWGWWPLAFVGLAWFSAIQRRLTTASDRFAAGFTLGCGWFFPAMAWMWFLTPPGYVVVVALFASFHGTAAWLSGLPSFSARRVVVAPALHTLAETLRLSFPFGGVPLATLGISQVSSPLHRLAAIGGVIALTWSTWQVAAILARPGSTSIREIVWRRGATIGCIAVIVIAGLAPSGAQTDRSLHIVSVQGGGPQGTRAINTDPREVVARHLDATRTVPTPDATHPIDLVIWPENVIDVVDFETSPEFEAVVEQAQRLAAPMTVGVTEDVSSRHFTNAQVVVTSDGRITSRYDKVRRVPFGEYIPLRGVLAAIGAPVNRVPRDALAGSEPAILDIPTAESSERAAVAISWEIFFAGRVREGVKRGAGFIINPTNGSSYTWTILQSQQIASSRLRALETGRWVAQVSPTGFSAFVDPSGHVHDRTKVSERAVLERTIPMRSGETMYVALGDGPWIAALGLVVGGCLVPDVRRRRSPYTAHR